jgi:hypothetical protein
MRAPGLAHLPCQVDRAEQASAIGRQRFLTARVGRADGLAVSQVVAGIDPVDDDDARLGTVVGGPRDAVPQCFGADGAEHLACENERPVLVVFDGRHEGVGDQGREVEVAQPPRLALGGNKGFDVGMVAPQRRHHGAGAGAGGHDGAAHRVPYIHEGQWPRGLGADALDQSAFGPERREVVADAAALLHGQRGLAQVTEDAAEVVLDVAHDKAVEQGHTAPGAGAGQNPSRRHEAEIFERLVERHLPFFWILLCGRERAGDAAPAVLYRDIDRGAVLGLQPIPGVPDLPGDRGDFVRGAPRLRIGSEIASGL